MTFKVHLLSASSPDLAYLAGRYAALRTAALTTSTAAFSSTFAIESAFTASQWIARLTRPNLHLFICAYYPDDAPEDCQTIEQGEWVGKITLLGPYPESDFELPPDPGSVVQPPGQQTRWQMTALYSNPAYRGMGVAKKLITEALCYAHSKDTSGTGTRVRIFVHPNNVAVVKLYENIGFALNGLVTLKEAYLMNGDASLLPPDGGSSNPEKYLTRAGLVMEHIQSV